MKKIIKKFSICLILILCSLFYVGCQKEEEPFKHKTIYFNPQYNGGKYKFEITVTEVSNDYSSDVWSRGLDATIEIKTITTEENIVGWLLEFYDFEFYLTKPYTIYETYMYIDNPKEKITQLVLEPQTTNKIHLRIDYDSSIFEEDVLDDYIITLWDMRI